MPQSDVLEGAPTAVVHKPLPHDSARLHVQGSANYVDDIREPEGTLHVAIGMADVPGKNDIAPVFADEPLLVEREVMFHGQAVFAVVARTRDEARRAARLGK